MLDIILSCERSRNTLNAHDDIDRFPGTVRRVIAPELKKFFVEHIGKGWYVMMHRLPPSRPAVVSTRSNARLAQQECDVRNNSGKEA